MSKYYCHRCAISYGIVNPSSPSSFTETSYQLEKFIKHTAPSESYGINSVFDDPSFEAYKNYVVTTTASGCVEIDDQGRTNMVWIAGSGIGATYHNNNFTCPADAIKVVLHDDEARIHAFPTESTPYRTALCEICGSPILT